LVKNWSKIGQKLVKNWSKIGQKLVKNWSKIGQILVKNAFVYISALLLVSFTGMVLIAVLFKVQVNLLPQEQGDQIGLFLA
jgi:hypothetical protein